MILKNSFIHSLIRSRDSQPYRPLLLYVKRHGNCSMIIKARAWHWLLISMEAEVRTQEIYQSRGMYININDKRSINR